MQVVIFQNNNGMTTMPTMPTSPDDAGAGGGRLRSARAVTVAERSVQSVNMMAQRVLTSMEMFLHMQHDDGECLRQTLCDNNRFSRTLTGTDRIWLPVWR